MSQNAVKRLYLMRVGSMPEYQIPIVCYLVQTDDGKNILIDSGLPTIIPEDQREFVNEHTIFEQLTTIGLQPDDIVRRRAIAFDPLCGYTYLSRHDTNAYQIKGVER